MAYEKDIETRIIRVTHKVTIPETGATVWSIAADMKTIPGAAKLIDFEEGDGKFNLYFREEREDQP